MAAAPTAAQTATAKTTIDLRNIAPFPEQWRFASPIPKLRA
jgi:hypothetical protein